MGFKKPAYPSNLDTTNILFVGEQINSNMPDIEYFTVANIFNKKTIDFDYKQFTR